ncbi:MAG: ABC transporter permease [Eubacterium sp.]|nr:ABC transporter permease [Eubacterium sp.]MCH4078665.1 ABC transporter permease [Eubacterium sp.]MCH4109806.1 ABC transporter permease [Eubacterium sp.]MCI1307014.1 ABC transporter permease [Eubacterium sp.]MCI1456468.1 ABC transporter permease [Eubacterium sp.]
MSSGNLTWTLALGNIRRERKFFIPYITASSGIIMMFYLMVYLWKDPGIQKLSTSVMLSMMMKFGTIIVGVFAVIFLFYINSFLMKRRNKEMGIYNILGMEKRHIGRILQAESLVTSLISIAAGILLGVIFSRLVYMIVMKILGSAVKLSSAVSQPGILYTVIFFALLFFLIQMTSRFRIHLARPVELLKGSDTGEREPKSRLFLTILGAAFLVYGYVTALTVKDGVAGIKSFFLAVLAVIAGTYLLFASISIVILKILKKNKKYYYQPSHFTTISGMLFRMKQNAVGMANICILATMVLVIVSTTVCLNTGIDKVVQNMAPEKTSVYGQIVGIRRDTGLHLMDDTSQKETIRMAQSAAAKENSKIKRIHVFAAYNPEVKYRLKNGTATYTLKSGVEKYTGSLMIIDAQQYKQITGKSLSLAENEALVNTPARVSQVKIGRLTYKAHFTSEKFLPTTASQYQSGTIVVKDRAAIKKIAAQDPAASLTFWRSIIFTAAGSDEVNKKIGNSLIVSTTWKTARPNASRDEGARPAAYYGNCDSHANINSTLKGFTNGFLFLGIFLGILFTLAAALIIYYKQVSEGYYDKDNFAIMQQVGMSQAEVKKSIRTQVKFVFFAPIIVAACHMGGAFNMMNRILQLFGLQDTTLFLKCTGITFLAFALLYLLVYLLTSREYYRIVSWKAGKRME